MEKRLFSRLMSIVSLLLALSVATAWAQSTSSITGTVTDASGAVVANAKVTATNQGTGEVRTAQSDDTGRYLISALPVGRYTVSVTAEGMQPQKAKDLAVEVSSNAVQNFQLKVGDVSQEVTVFAADNPVIESTTMSVGLVINQRSVQEVPLNGRHIEDLINLVPGSATPPQNGFLTAPLRGQGSFGAISAGNREDTVNFQVNGVNLQDPVQNQTTFQPSINTIAEFKVLNSTFSSEYGHTSGSMMNVATRSGTNDIHGEVFDFLRNNSLDSKNRFDNPNLPIPPFKRNNFGVAAGGPMFLPFYNGRNKTFWFFSYEGLRQRQSVAFNVPVPTAAQRAAVTNPTVLNLLPLIPLANNGNNFSGSGSAPVNIDQYTGDVSHRFSDKDQIHGYYARQLDTRKEPAAPVSASTLPGFGDARTATRQLVTINETHIFNNNLINELRVGANRIEITFNGANTQDPTTFGFTGLSSFGLPEIAVQNGFDFGGVSGFPQGRADTNYVFADTLSWTYGKHSFKFGTEERKYFNNNFNNDVGRFLFSSIPNFINGTAAQFTFNQGGTTSAISAGALQFFAQDNYKILPNLTLELGIRYERNLTPTERNDHFIAFDPATGSLRQVGSPGFDQLFDDNNDFMPRVGFSWDPFKTGKTVVRGGYGIFYDQPVANAVTGLASNLPFSNTIQITPPPSFGNPLLGTPVGGSTISPPTICECFEDANVQNWNLNIQHEVTPTIGVMVGYFGSKGTHLRLTRNANQPVGGVKPFSTITLIDGSTRPVNTINEVTSIGNSNYNALWVTANKRMSNGLQFNASYTWSKSFDYNSRNTQGNVLQDSNNPRNNYGLSDFDVRQRFVINYVYDLPFKGSHGFVPARAVEGWELSGIFSEQSGNPVSITLAGISPLTNAAGTVRPDLVGNPVQSKSVASFFNPLAFAAPAAGQFGNSGRNTIIGPRFVDWDFSILKTTNVNERVKVELRTEFFNLLNHPNLGQPGASCSASSVPFTVSSISGQVFAKGTCTPNASFGTITNAATGATINPSTFGQILNTRFPSGDVGSARQIQFVLKIKF